MSYWLKVKSTHHQVAIAGQVTDGQTGRAIGDALVRISSAPEPFITRLAIPAKLVTLGKVPVEVQQAREKLDDPNVNGPEKLEAARIVLDYLQARRLARFNRPDQTRTAADGHFHFVDLLADGDYTLIASLPGAGMRFGRAQVEVTVSSSMMATADLALPPTTVKGQITTLGLDENNQPVEVPVVMAEVRVQGSGERTFSDSEGHYRLTGLEASQKQDRIILVGTQEFQPASQSVRLSQVGAEVTVNFSLGK